MLAVGTPQVGEGEPAGLGFEDQRRPAPVVPKGYVDAIGRDQRDESERQNERGDENDYIRACRHRNGPSCAAASWAISSRIRSVSGSRDARHTASARGSANSAATRVALLTLR